MRLALMAALVIGGCSADPVVIADVRAPDARLLVPAKVLKLPADAQANSVMWESYGQCRLAHVDEADLRRGFIDYVRALQGR